MHTCNIPESASPSHYEAPQPVRGIGGAPTRATTLPTDSKARKQFPVASGVLDYFPDAIVALSQLSWKGNEQHNPGKPMYWNRSKSGDESDTMIRHFLQRGTLDNDSVRHSAKLAWRALALLQKEIEAEQTAHMLTPEPPAPKLLAPELPTHDVGEQNICKHCRMSIYLHREGWLHIVTGCNHCKGTNTQAEPSGTVPGTICKHCEEPIIRSYAWLSGWVHLLPDNTRVYRCYPNMGLDHRVAEPFSVDVAPKTS